MVYANPYNACMQCGCRTVDRVDNANQPCGHRGDFISVCPSWSPVDGCQCVATLGSRIHGDPVLPRDLSAADVRELATACTCDGGSLHEVWCAKVLARLA